MNTKKCQHCNKVYFDIGKEECPFCNKKEVEIPEFLKDIFGFKK